ncbi:MAG TPA: hypothetical protein PLB89_07055 [Flavobacteriales bacterium]|nr:hypothetical protein [Flavobacteriales bacterium]
MILLRPCEWLGTFLEKDGLRGSAQSDGEQELKAQQHQARQKRGA